MYPHKNSEQFEPHSAGQVYRLTNDWQKLLALLPKLDAAACVYRGHYVIHCIAQSLPQMSLSQNTAIWSEGVRGYSADLATWSEAWFYHETRNETLFPCVEIADALGRGLLKICFNSPTLSPKDRHLIKELTQMDGDSWDLLHLYPTNKMECCKKLKFPCRRQFSHALSEIQREAFLKDSKLGIIVKGLGQSCWNSFATSSLIPLQWQCLGDAREFVSLLPHAYPKVEVIDRSSRAIIMFSDEQQNGFLSIVEEEGKPLDSIRNFAHSLR